MGKQKKDIYLLGALRLDKSTKLNLSDSKGFVSLGKLGLPEDFYGGRVKNLARTEEDDVYLLVDEHDAFDVLVTDLEALTKRQLVFTAERKLGIKLSIDDVKDELKKQIRAKL